jgi:predicted transcriptional regulator
MVRFGIGGVSQNEIETDALPASLDSCSVALYLRGMNVRITPEQVARLADLASRTGKDADELIQEAVTKFLDEDARFLKAVEEGFESLDRGKFVTHEEVRARLDRVLRS